MTGLVRHWICDGDLTTASGTVKATALGEKINGKERAYEGDAVECPTCKSTGHIQCVPPIRPAIGMDGRQKAAEGDLCICKCPTPPRLIASQTLSKAAFHPSEVISNPSAVDWLLASAYKVDDYGVSVVEQYFELINESGEPLNGFVHSLYVDGDLYAEAESLSGGKTASISSNSILHFSAWRENDGATKT